MRWVMLGLLLEPVCAEPVKTPAPTPIVVQAPAPPRESRAEIGRYHVTPHFGVTRGPVLLDSATGDTWIACVDPNGIKAWCDMDRGGVQLGEKR